MGKGWSPGGKTNICKLSRGVGIHKGDQEGMIRELKLQFMKISHENNVLKAQ